MGKTSKKELIKLAICATVFLGVLQWKFIIEPSNEKNRILNDEITSKSKMLEDNSEEVDIESVKAEYEELKIKEESYENIIPKEFESHWVISDINHIGKSNRVKVEKIDFVGSVENTENIEESMESDSYEIKEEESDEVDGDKKEYNKKKVSITTKGSRKNLINFIKELEEGFRFKVVEKYSLTEEKQQEITLELDLIYYYEKDKI